MFLKVSLAYKMHKRLWIILIVLLILIAIAITIFYLAVPAVYGKGLSVENYSGISPNFVNDFFGPAIWYINLPGRDTRRKSCEEQLQKLGINGNYSPGVLLNDSQYETLKDKYSGLSKGQIGCILAHCKVYKKLLETNQEWGLVCEDDIYAIPEVTQQAFGRVMQQVLLYNPNAEIVFFGYTWPILTWRKGRRLIYKGKSLKVSTGRPLSTHCYAIHRDTAAKNLRILTQNGSKIPIDNWLQSNIPPENSFIVDADMKKGHKKIGYGFGFLQQQLNIGSDISSSSRLFIGQFIT